MAAALRPPSPIPFYTSFFLCLPSSTYSFFGVEGNFCTGSQLHTLGKTPLDEWSARRTDLYLTTNNTHKRQTSMPPGGFEPAIAANKRPQTHASDRAATGIGHFLFVYLFLFIYWYSNSNLPAKLYTSVVLVDAHTELLLTRLPQQCSCLHPNLTQPP